MTEVSLSLLKTFSCQQGLRPKVSLLIGSADRNSSSIDNSPVRTKTVL